MVPVVPGTVDRSDVGFWAGGAYTGGFIGRGRELHTHTYTHVYYTTCEVSSANMGF